MPVKENSATALVRVRGLGIVCFNRFKNRGEMGLLRDGKHTLSLKISKPVFIEEATSDTVSYDDIVTYESLDPLSTEIEISGEGNSTVNGYEIFMGEKFDRLNAEDNDPNDFRWIVRMESEELHGGALVRNDDVAARSQIQVSQLFVSNALFYTNDINENLVFEKIKKEAGGKEVGREDFGFIAETVGAKIESEFVRVRIKTGGEEHIHVFPRVIGSPVKIEVNNIDFNSKSIVSDMPDYYRFLKDESGVEFDLNNVNNDGQAAGDSTTGDDFCHIIWSDFDCLVALLTGNPCY
jgi:hypothetical protein